MGTIYLETDDDDVAEVERLVKIAIAREVERLRIRVFFSERELEAYERAHQMTTAHAMTEINPNNFPGGKDAYLNWEYEYWKLQRYESEYKRLKELRYHHEDVSV